MSLDVQITTGLAGESGHWYYPDGKPAYQIEAKNGNMRPVTLRDARKYGFYPSVTTILKTMAAPGLEIWKQKQILLAALTLPAIDGESLDAYSARIMADSGRQAEVARQRGTDIHAAIEAHYRGDVVPFEYMQHVQAAIDQISPLGYDFEPERSFYHPLGYGGKTDLHSRSSNIVLDVKTKEFSEDDTKKMVYDEHIIQLAAYRHGLVMPGAVCGNIFVSTSVPGLACAVIHSEEELRRGMRMFRLLLQLWKEKNKFNPSHKEAA